MTLYRDVILSHYKNPQNKGELETFTHQATQSNPTCGDEITMQVFVEEGQVKEVRFSGKGCAISQASCSLLTDYIKGENIESIQALNLPDIVTLLGGEQISPGRIKCATLGLDVLKKALS